MRGPPSWLILTLALSIGVAPVVATAQPRGNIPLVGVLEPGSQEQYADCLPAFQQGLRDLGYVEGQHVRFEYRYAEGHTDRLAVLAATRVITTIPMVMGVASNLEDLGLVTSLAQPGSNLTGLDFRSLKLMGKQLELFKEAVPTISRVAVLVDPARADHARVPGNIVQEALALGVQLQRVEVSAPEAFEAGFAAMVHGGANALMLMDTALFAAHRQGLLALALRHRLPTMSYGRHFAEAGSLLAYGADPRALCQRSAIFVDKILKGAKPADLPIERPEFHLVINLKTAEALGLTISPMVLFRANEVVK
jgi:putative ABC transport system substrate-binding protein